MGFSSFYVSMIFMLSMYICFYCDFVKKVNPLLLFCLPLASLTRPNRESKPREEESPKAETETAKPEVTAPSGDDTLNVTSADDSVAIADTTGEITLDSVTIHLK